MCINDENDSLSKLLETVKRTPSRSERRRSMAREILRSEELRTELFQLATVEPRDRQSMEKRRRYRNVIVWLMQESGGIYRGFGVKPEVYQEAVARTWEWFGKNFDKYQPNRASFVTWFNIRLHFWIVDVRLEEAQERRERQFPSLDKETGAVIEPLNLVSDPKQDPELLVEFNYLIEELQTWLRRKKRSLSRRCISRCRQANCYNILLRYLPVRNTANGCGRMGMTLTEIANSLEVAESDIKRCFRDKCWPELKGFLSKQGYY